MDEGGCSHLGGIAWVTAFTCQATAAVPLNVETGSGNLHHLTVPATLQCTRILHALSYDLHSIAAILVGHSLSSKSSKTPNVLVYHYFCAPSSRLTLKKASLANLPRLFHDNRPAGWSMILSNSFTIAILTS
jgi:hypothetical protein